jgi:Na+/phosphate symporter
MWVVGLALLVAIIGVLMYALCTNNKLQEIGKMMFFAGLLAFLLGGGKILIDMTK